MIHSVSQLRSRVILLIKLYIGAKVVMLVQDPTKVDQALKIKDPKIKAGRNYFPISLNLREPY
jgi:hypothetical protein